jgi:hypothetical protein
MIPLAHSLSPLYLSLSLCSFFQLIEARLSHLDDFLRLAGRLDLILSQQVGSAEGDSSVQVERMRTFKA